MTFVLATCIARTAAGQSPVAPEDITSASKHAEPLRESPVPVTVITDTMIADIGAMNLKDVLVTYVPGMTFSQDHNEVNVAMRGVYASSQQKVLILLNGHALNSRALESAVPDFSISLDQIKRIEVIRGPASSLYGNGALAAVVNIFTKTAADVDGSAVTVGGGNFGQVKLNGVFGARTTKGADVIMWGALYRSGGEVVDIPAAQDYSRVPADSHAILNGFRGPMSHDVGMRLQMGPITFHGGHRLGKYTEPFSAGGPTGETYNYDDYQTDHGVGPGQSVESLNLDVSHEQRHGKTNVLLRGYVDRSNLSAHLITDPSVKAHSAVVFDEWDAGLIAEVSGTYGAGSRQGHWLAGGQADVMRVFDGVLTTGTGGGWTNVGPSGGLVDLGDEKIYSGYVQIKQPLGEKWIGSGGVRAEEDPARRRGRRTASPRLALTWLPDARSSVTASYAESFLDAPYWYRYNSLPSYRGSRGLKPEHLKSFQITPATTLPHGVNLRWNVFVNDLTDLVWRNNNAGPGEPNYQNAGFLKSWGVEQEASLTRPSFNILGNVTYQRDSSAQNYAVTGAQVHNVPNWSWTAILNVTPHTEALGKVAFNVTTRYIGEQLSPINVTVGTKVFFEPDRVVDRAFLVNAGVRVGRSASARWFLDARISNLFGTDYEQGGSVSHPYPQPGTWVMLSVGHRF